MTNLIAFDTGVGMKKIQELRLILKEKIGSKAITQVSLAKTTGVDQATPPCNPALYAILINLYSLSMPSLLTRSGGFLFAF